MSASSVDLPGFADPVHDSQACFRAVLDAMSRPGIVGSVPAGVRAPGLDPATAAVALTLLDAETPVFLDPAFAAARDWIAFHCGAGFVAPGEAAYAIAAAVAELGAFPAGTDDEPQAGATVVVQVPALSGGPALRLTGPGVDGALTVRPAVPASFPASWAANHGLFPRGVDLILCAGSELMALPRSVKVEAV